MIEPGGEFYLPQETLGPERARQLGMQHLQRHRSIVLGVLGEVNRRHPPAPKFPIDCVDVAQGVFQPVDRESCGNGLIQYVRGR